MTYLTELTTWVKHQSKKPRQDKHVVVFLALRNDVQAALDAGYAMRTIWTHMQETGRLQYRYETFTQHVRRYIKTASAAPASPATTTSTSVKKLKSEPPKIGGFTFDAKPRKEDLL